MLKFLCLRDLNVCCQSGDDGVMGKENPKRQGGGVKTSKFFLFKLPVLFGTHFFFKVHNLTRVEVI